MSIPHPVGGFETVHPVTGRNAENGSVLPSLSPLTATGLTGVVFLGDGRFFLLKHPNIAIITAMRAGFVHLLSERHDTSIFSRKPIRTSVGESERWYFYPIIGSIALTIREIE
jgi:hypothetical protein